MSTVCAWYGREGTPKCIETLEAFGASGGGNRGNRLACVSFMSPENHSYVKSSTRYAPVSIVFRQKHMNDSKFIESRPRWIDCLRKRGILV